MTLASLHPAVLAVRYAVAIGAQVDVVTLSAKGAQARLAMPGRAEEGVLDLPIVIGGKPVVEAKL